MALLELCNLTRRFGGLVAADDVSLAIESGEFVTLLEPSGWLLLIAEEFGLVVKRLAD